MKKHLSVMASVLLLLATIISPSMLLATASPGTVKFTLEGYTLGPPGEGYTTGLVRGYDECEWIPFNLTIVNGQSSSISLNIVMDLDYRVKTGASAGAIGIDAFGIDGTVPNRWKVRVVDVTNGGFTDLGTEKEIYSFPQKDVLRFSFSLTVPANTKVWVLWVNHLALTGGTNLYEGGTIDMGASYWPGARLHVQASLTGDVTGKHTVPIKSPPLPEIPGQATISGVKFHDVDADGVRDPEEEGLEGWTIQLLSDNTVVSEMDTDESGGYIFTLIEGQEGDYKIVEVLKDGWMQTAPAGGYHEVEVEMGKTYTDLDFGNIELGSISGYKFYDVNVNGVWDGSEGAIQGWKVCLTGEDILDNTVDKYAYTDSTGKFIFEDLLPGTYTVEEVFPLGMWVNTTATSFSHELEEGEDYVGPDFGNVCLKPGIGGKTLGFWTNRNGQALINASDVSALNALNLYKPTGWRYPPFNAGLSTAKTQINNYLLRATAVDMRWMLSAQLIATTLNVRKGFLSSSTMVYVGPSTYVPSGFITIGEIMDNANTALDKLQTAFRAEQEYWKNLLDGLNNNWLPFVCPTPCPIVYP